MPLPTTRRIVLATLLLPLGLAPACQSSQAAAPAEEPQFEVIALAYAAAPELAATIQELVAQPAVPETSGVKVLADPRTNSLLVMASPKQMPEVKDLIALLDVDATAGG
jgi:type II secretory pathway component GspD/PulD (secretin)